MKKILTILFCLISFPSFAADNALTVTVGSGLTMRTVDVGSGVQSSVHILGNISGTPIYGTAGTANAAVLTIQGIASGTVVPVSLTSTTITGTVAATQSGTWTVQPGNTANTTAWLVTGTGGTFPATQSGTWNITNISGTITLPTGASTAAKQPVLGTAGSASTDVISIQGIASMTPLLANPGTAANWAVGATGSAVPANAIYNGVNVAGNNRGVTGLALGSTFSPTIAIVDASGNQITSFGGSGGTASNYGSAFPSSGTAIGFTDGTNMVAARVGAITNSTAATNYLNTNPACNYNATPLTVTDTRYQGIQCDVNGFLKVNVATATGLAQGSTTSGQTGSLIMGAVTTASPTYTTAQTSPLSLDTAGGLRVSIIAGGGSGGTASTFGAAFPATGTAIGVSDGTNMIALRSGTAGTAAPTVITVQGVASMTKLLVTPDSVALPANQSVNLSQVNAVTVLTGTGAVGTGAQRIAVGTDTATIAGSAPGTAGTASTNVITVQGIASMTKLLVTPDANSAINVAQINGVTPLMGNGATGTGSQRVTLASDGTAISTAGYMSVKIDQTTSGTTYAVRAIAGTTGGASTTGNIAANNTTAVVVKASAGTLFGVQIYGIGAAPAYLKIYNAASATCGSGTPVKRLMIPAASTAANGAGSNINFGASGVAFGTGITYCVTTGITDADTTAPAASTFLINVDWL